MDWIWATGEETIGITRSGSRRLLASLRLNTLLVGSPGSVRFPDSSNPRLRWLKHKWLELVFYGLLFCTNTYRCALIFSFRVLTRFIDASKNLRILRIEATEKSKVPHKSTDKSTRTR